jgi:hypothetical protein
MSARDLFRSLFGPLNQAAEAELGRRLDAHRAEVTTEALHNAADSVSVIHQDCHRDREVCAGCQVRADVVDVLRSLADVLGEEATAPAATATPDFFQPGHAYTDGTGYTAPEITTVFRVEHVTRHPDRGHLRAIGWSKTGAPDATWHGDFRDEGEFDGWTDITKSGGAR